MCQNFYLSNHGNASLLCKHLEWVLHDTYLEFDGIVYRQIQGTAMCSPMALTYACICMFELRGDVLGTHACDILSHHRYIIKR